MLKVLVEESDPCLASFSFCARFPDYKIDGGGWKVLVKQWLHVNALEFFRFVLKRVSMEEVSFFCQTIGLYCTRHKILSSGIHWRLPNAY